MRNSIALVAFALPLLGSCGSVTSTPEDAGPADASATRDAGDVDAPLVDAMVEPKRCPDGMAHIPAGTFTLSDGDATIVSVAAYCIDTHLVTMAEYNLCDTTQGCTSAGVDSAGDEATYCNKNYAARADDPANCVTVPQAEIYCSEQGKSLPSEEEWEWAARGGPAARLYPWGAAVPMASDAPERLCWEANRPVPGPVWPLRPQGTCPVGTFNQAASHPFGLEDMSGNIWHWTTSGDAAARIVRGGGWDNGLAAGSASRMTTLFRNGPIAIGTSHAAVGFRCVDELLPL